MGSVVVRIHSIYSGTVRNWNGTVSYEITFTSGPIWHLVADLIRTGSIRSRVNAVLMFDLTEFVNKGGDALWWELKVLYCIFRA